MKLKRNRERRDRFSTPRCQPDDLGKWRTDHGEEPTQGKQRDAKTQETGPSQAQCFQSLSEGADIDDAGEALTRVRGSSASMKGLTMSHSSFSSAVCQSVFQGKFAILPNDEGIDENFFYESALLAPTLKGKL